jgi:hypothetical protein
LGQVPLNRCSNPECLVGERANFECLNQLLQ